MTRDRVSLTKLGGMVGQEKLGRMDWENAKPEPEVFQEEEKRKA